MRRTTTSRRAARGTSSAFRTTTSCTSREVAAGLPHVDLVGLDMHLGSQLSRIDPYREGTERLASIFAELTKRGITTLDYLDIGGGLGVRYDTEQPPDLQRFAEMVLPTVAETGLSSSWSRDASWSATPARSSDACSIASTAAGKTTWLPTRG